MRPKDNNSKPGWFTGNVSVPGPGAENQNPELVPGTMKPVDVESLSPKQRAVLELLTEKSERAHEAGIDSPTHTITPSEVKAKLQELKNRKR